MIAKKLPKEIEIRIRKLGREKASGLAWIEDALVEIDPGLGEKDRLDTIIHEVTHVLFPDATEKQVQGVSKRLTKVLWRDGWRRVPGVARRRRAKKRRPLA